MPSIIKDPLGRLEVYYTHNKDQILQLFLYYMPTQVIGGNMNNPLSLKLHKLFSDIGFSTLRFNFRGKTGQMESMMEVREN